MVTCIFWGWAGDLAGFGSRFISLLCDSLSVGEIFVIVDSFLGVGGTGAVCGQNFKEKSGTGGGDYGLWLCIWDCICRVLGNQLGGEMGV